jgi:hypothetical protein
MANHKDLLARVALRVGADAVGSASSADGDPAALGFSKANPEDRTLLVSFILHAADLHNPLLPAAVSQRIATELSREFEGQAKLEREASLPITVMQAVDDEQKSKMEIGFISFVVRPLYQTLAKIAPALGARCLELVDANKAAWAEVMADAAVASAAG